jgi:hypothetical protein
LQGHVQNSLSKLYHRNRIELAGVASAKGLALHLTAAASTAQITEFTHGGGEVSLL